jgi:predicted nucleotidyltransferase
MFSRIAYWARSGNMKERFHGLPRGYRDDITKAVGILKAEGCKEVYLFGSLAEGRVDECSDIDLAIRGCPPGKFFELLGKLLLELSHSVDLVNLDKKSDFAQFIEREGALINVQ